MHHRSIGSPLAFLLLCCAPAVLFLTAGCFTSTGAAKKETFSLSGLHTTAVVGFRPALSAGESPQVVRNPVSGLLFPAEPVAQDNAETLTRILFHMLSNKERFDLIPPGTLMGVYSSLVSQDMNIEDRAVFQEIGRAFSANAVLIGYVYRWVEREGTDYAVNRPASVAFDLYLVGVDHGRTLWKGIYDKTQRSLSENLFDMSTFINSKGKWMTAEDLARIGLRSLLETWSDKQPEEKN